MDWLRAHYDRAALIAAALLLLLSSVFAWMRASGLEESFAPLRVAPAQNSKVPETKAQELIAAGEKVNAPAQWTFSSRSGLFVPERHFVTATGELATLQSNEVHPPVPNEWFEERGLPITDADVLEQDPDGDGFTNLDEWRGQTDPLAKDSHPAYTNKLALKSVTQEPFRLKFTSWNPATKTHEINAIDLREPTQYLKLGETVRGTSFKVLTFTEKHTQNPATGGDMDVSELLLENQETKERLTLVLDRVVTSPNSVATFLYTWGGNREMKIKQGQEFSLPPEAEIKYKLLDVQPDRAVIVDTRKPDQRIEIGKLQS